MKDVQDDFGTIDWDVFREKLGEAVVLTLVRAQDREVRLGEPIDSGLLIAGALVAIERQVAWIADAVASEDGFVALPLRAIEDTAEKIEGHVFKIWEAIRAG